MKSNWPEFTLKDVCLHITDGAHNSPKSVKEGLPMASVKDLTHQGITLGTCRLISEVDFAKLVRQGNHLLVGDIIIAKDGASALDTVCEIKEQVNVVLLSSIAILRPNPHKLISGYLRYYLDCDTTRQYMKGAFITGAAIPRVVLEDFKRVMIRIPPLPTQHKIAAILSAYDDLIENNTRRIKILEEMAQTIYREWFVHFRFPGHEKVKMVDSPLGKLPAAWKQNFSNFVDFKEGPGLRRWQYREKGLPFLNIRTLVNNDIDFSKIQYLDEEEVNEKYKHFLLEPDDHVISSSGTLGRLVTIQENHLPLMLNTSIIRMRPKKKNVGKWQLKHFLKSEYFQNQIISQATGVAQANFGPSHLNKMWILAPNETMGQKYEMLVTPIEEKILLLVHKNKILRCTRDLLLPKLISGEMDVSDLDIDIGETEV